MCEFNRTDHILATHSQYWPLTTMVTGGKFAWQLMDPSVMSPFILHRRQFLRNSGVSLGTAALTQLLSRDLLADEAPERNSIGGLAELPHFPPKARRVIYLFQGGGPSQLDLFNYKPQPGSRSRFERDHPAHFGRRPYASDLSVSRPPFSLDGCARNGCEEGSGLRRGAGAFGAFDVLTFGESRTISHALPE